ncbi:type I-E CRISPR-associated protein Cas5/CasD [Halomonas piscis]|uniref:Type I-E CRISPR-associated protein Cas5/CasD n=1 Tax=Halomonas piscis TaxID=3031727 RepID=A0ABY9Z1L3_9GAMM|nr:type I-E CRISPR-associated protein Cas5/CasD [Halomonas piscis]WNK20571.1 type I-E CRISPR-associated protein Cas5/CasD [Halomonas piscis]
MTDYLVFRLYAPLASWGEAAVGETRPTASYPGKSALLGLVGAALGIRRDDDAGQKALREGLAFGVKQRSSGTLMRDYHTVQVPPAKAKVRYSTRKDELSIPKGDLNTILSARDYRCDGLWNVACWLKPGAAWTLAELRQALERPYFCLYLGRKACPPAVPLSPIVVACETLKDALDSEFPPLNGRSDAGEKALRPSKRALYAWEGEIHRLDGSAEGVEHNDIWDMPLNRRRWQFGPRLEYRRVMQDKEGR